MFWGPPSERAVSCQRRSSQLPSKPKPRGLLHRAAMAGLVLPQSLVEVSVTSSGNPPAQATLQSRGPSSLTWACFLVRLPFYWVATPALFNHREGITMVGKKSFF